MRKILFFLFVLFWLLESSAMAAGSIMLASWYGSSALDGNLMANGEPFKSSDKTIAAHPTLPFGTRLRVKNPDNGRELTVVVKDRGPFLGGRRLDLSLAAARHLDYVRKGVTNLVVIRKHRR